MKFTTAAAGLLAMGPLVHGHTLFSRMFVDGESQGDGTCIRMPEDGSTATAPIDGLTSDEMACGRDGEIAASFVCPASASSTLTFEFREWPNARHEGSIDGSHRGPCSVYVKRVDDIFSDRAAGPGWTKVWHEGYDEDAGQWCTEKLIENKGLLSFELPSGLPAGYYLVRPELLALHQAASLNDPQYYVACAQIYIQDGPSTLDVPSEHTVSIPGYMDGSEPGNSFNVYERPMALPYPIPGPEPFSPAGTASGVATLNATEIDGAIPGDCVVKNANWCGRPMESYSSESGCWDAVEKCFAQGSACFDATNPTGVENCERWNKEMCHVIQAGCRARDFNGPPSVQIEEHEAPVPGDLPAVVNRGAGDASAGSGPEEPATTAASSSAAAASSPAAATTSPAAAATTTSPAEADVTASPIFSTISSAAPEIASPIASSSTSEAPVSAPSASPVAGLVASPDGTCGGDTGFTCEGSRFGGCCSRFGRCGRRSRACGCHCQPLFGRCNDVSEA